MAKKQLRRAKGSATSQKGIEAEFVYESSEAKDVCVAGDFNNWSSHCLPMHNEDDCRWRVRVPLAAGSYE